MATVYAYGNRISYSQSTDCDCNSSVSISMSLSNRDTKNIVPELLSMLSIDEIESIVVKAYKLRENRMQAEKEEIARNKA